MFNRDSEISEEKMPNLYVTEEVISSFKSFLSVTIKFFQILPLYIK